MRGVMSPLSLQQTIDMLAADGDAFTIDAPDAWAQGRTLYGGMSAALCYETAKRALGDLGQLRSAQFGFIGPSAGALRFTPSLLRRGRSSTVAAVDCTAESGLATRALLVFGGDRESVLAHDRIPALPVPPPDACEPFHRSSKPLPGFLANYEFRLAAGARLFETDKPPEFAIWTRFRAGGATDPVTSLLAMGDALPTAAMAAFPKIAPVSTMTWQIDLPGPLPAEDGWRLVWSSSESAANGYTLQAMRVSDEAGRTLAVARQVVALFI